MHYCEDLGTTFENYYHSKTKTHRPVKLSHALARDLPKVRSYLSRGGMNSFQENECAGYERPKLN
jgi:hypothetical protein